MPVGKSDVPKADKAPTLFRAKSSFATTLKGEAEPVIVRIGDLVDEKDPVLKGREELFEPFEAKTRLARRHG